MNPFFVSTQQTLRQSECLSSTTTEKKRLEKCPKEGYITDEDGSVAVIVLDTTVSLITDVSVDISGMVGSGGVGVSGREEEEEDEDSSGREKDDEEDESDIDDVNHTNLPKTHYQT